MTEITTNQVCVINTFIITLGTVITFITLFLCISYVNIVGLNKRK